MNIFRSLNWLLNVHLAFQESNHHRLLKRKWTVNCFVCAILHLSFLSPIELHFAEMEFSHFSFWAKNCHTKRKKVQRPESGAISSTCPTCVAILQSSEPFLLRHETQRNEKLQVILISWDDCFRTAVLLTGWFIMCHSRCLRCVIRTELCKMCSDVAGLITSSVRSRRSGGGGAVGRRSSAATPLRPSRRCESCVPTGHNDTDHKELAPRPRLCSWFLWKMRLWSCLSVERRVRESRPVGCVFFSVLLSLRSGHWTWPPDPVLELGKVNSTLSPTTKISTGSVLSCGTGLSF